MKTVNTLGEKIRELRLAAGLSQAELGGAAGVSGSAMSQLEAGISKSPKAETLLKMAKALRVEPSQLLEEPTEASQPTQDEIQILKLYRALPPGHKDIAARLLKALK